MTPFVRLGFVQLFVRLMHCSVQNFILIIYHELDLWLTVQGVFYLSKPLFPNTRVSCDRVSCCVSLLNHWWCSAFGLLFWIKDWLQIRDVRLKFGQFLDANGILSLVWNSWTGASCAQARWRKLRRRWMDLLPLSACEGVNTQENMEQSSVCKDLHPGALSIKHVISTSYSFNTVLFHV